MLPVAGHEVLVEIPDSVIRNLAAAALILLLYAVLTAVEKKSFGVKMRSNYVDIGVRVEMKDIIWREFSDRIYEPKILYRTKTFEDRCRMFCFNKGGLVSAENNLSRRKIFLIIRQKIPWFFPRKEPWDFCISHKIQLFWILRK